MHPAVFIHKVKKRLRRFGELCCPKLGLSFSSIVINTNNSFPNWTDSVPFSSNIPIKDRLTHQERKDLILHADVICRHEFMLLGNEKYSFGSKIDWHLDFKSGFRWPDDLIYSRIPQVVAVNADIKVPWELNRFHHAVVLGFAWQCSGDNKYHRDLFNEIDDWIEKNPVGYGVNWVCPMEVAIRAVNWLASIALLIDPLMSKDLSKFRDKLASSLWQHAAFIRSHMEWLGPKADAGANHLLFNLAGLFTLGVFFRDTRKGMKLLTYAHDKLEAQIKRQVLSDGVHFECSLSYHRFCFEVLLWCGALAQKVGIPFSISFYEQLEKMQQFVSDYTKPTMQSPLIGDNDDGRLFNCGLLDLRDHSYLMVEDSSGTFFIDRFLLDGTESVKADYSIQSACYTDGGFFFLKNETAYVAIRAGRLAYKGTHAHNDQLSFELNLNGTDIFVDRGTYLYTPDSDARNRYRSTEAHNVLQINGQEQNPLGTPFCGLNDETEIRIIEETKSSIEAIHYGFRTLNRLNTHYSRSLNLESKNLVIKDSVNSLQSGDVLNWSFHLAPGINTQVDAEKVSILQNGSLLCNLICSFEGNILVKNFPHSPSYGILENAQVIIVKYNITQQPTESFEFNIVWEL